MKAAINIFLIVTIFSILGLFSSITASNLMSDCVCVATVGEKEAIADEFVPSCLGRATIKIISKKDGACNDFPVCFEVEPADCKFSYVIAVVSKNDDTPIEELLVQHGQGGASGSTWTWDTVATVRNFKGFTFSSDIIVDCGSQGAIRLMIKCAGDEQFTQVAKQILLCGECSAPGHG